MRKIIFVALSIILVVILISVIFNSCYNSTDIVFGWDAEKSFFVDYAIKGNTVFIRYSICYVNNADKDYYVSAPVASFKSREIKGWAKENSFIGSFENGEAEHCIKAHSKENIIIVFEGEYLGGEVNEKLSPPKSLVFSTSDEETLKQRRQKGQGDG